MPPSTGPACYVRCEDVQYIIFNLETQSSSVLHPVRLLHSWAAPEIQQKLHQTNQAEIDGIPTNAPNDLSVLA